MYALRAQWTQSVVNLAMNKIIAKFLPNFDAAAMSPGLT
jgi:hypothetical protein